MATPNNTTENHDLQLWSDGQTPWEHRTDMETLDTAAEIRDTAANRGNYNPKAGALFRATDTKRVYRGDGSQWLRHDPPTTGVINVERYPGAGVASQIENALADLEANGTSQRIDVTPPDDGSALTWDKRLDLDTTLYPNGIHIHIHQGVEINGTVEDWWISVTGNNGTQQQTFRLDAIHSEIHFTGDDTATPGVLGFIRIDDQNEPEVRCNTRNFDNGNTNSTAILFRNVNTWSEGWTVEGNQRGCNRALDFKNVGGFPSFRDGDVYKFSAAGHDYCVRFEGNHKGLNVHNLHCFPSADNAVGILLDGNLSGASFVGTTIDDTTGYAGITAFKTSSSYAPQGHKFLFYGIEGNNVDTWVDKNQAAHDIWEVFSDGGFVGIRDVELRDGAGSSFQLNRTGTTKFTADDGSEFIQFNPVPSVETPNSGGLVFNTTIRAAEGVKTILQTGPPTLNNDEGAWFFDDGTNFEAGTFAVESDVAGIESGNIPVRHPDGSSSLPTQDLSAITPTADRTYYSDGTNMTRGPAFYDGTTFTSLVDGTTYTP